MAEPGLSVWATVKTLAAAISSWTKALDRQTAVLERIALSQERLLKTKLIYADMTLAEFDALVPGEQSKESAPEVELQGVGDDINRVKWLEEMYKRAHGVPPPEDWDPDESVRDEKMFPLGDGVDGRSPVPEWVQRLRGDPPQ